MTPESFGKSDAQSQELASERASRRCRRWSSLVFAREVLIAVALLAGIGVVLSIGSSALELVIPR